MLTSLATRARLLARAHSVQIAAIGALLSGILAVDPAVLQAGWQTMPAEVRALIPEHVSVWISGILFVLVMVARAVPQPTVAQQLGLLSVGATKRPAQGITLGQRSRLRLAGVHPDLVRVIERAAANAEPQDDFTVLEGVRTRKQCFTNYGKGRTAAECIAAGVPADYAAPGAGKVTWLRNPLSSKHYPRADGFSHAVDLAPYPIDWNDLARFDRVAALVMAAAKEEGVAIRWGADWDRDGKPRERGETDSPHFELDR